MSDASRSPSTPQPEQGSRPPSRARHPAPQPEQTSRPPSRANRRDRSRSQPPSEAESDSAPGRSQSRSARRRRNRKRDQTGGSQLPAVDELDDTTQQVGTTAKGVTNTPKNAEGGTAGQGSGGKDALRLRLDLNLDVYIELKAKIHGDLTLALL